MSTDYPGDLEAVRRESKARAFALIEGTARRARLDVTPIPERYLMATTAVHVLGDLSRDVADLVIVYGETRTEWVGEWATGVGFVNVRFPKATTRELTPEEKEHFSGLVIECGVLPTRPIVFPEGQE